MCSNKCETFLKASIKTLVNINTNDENNVDDIVTCINSCLRKIFIKWAQIRYSGKPSDEISFAADIAFTDGVLKLKDKAEKNELYDGNASIKTVVFNFFYHKLLGNLKQQDRLDEKKQRYGDDNVLKSAINEDEYLINEKRFTMLEQAMEQLESADRQIIKWRHIENKKPEEIAVLLGITTPAATNRIYRCMERLRKLLNKNN